MDEQEWVTSTSPQRLLGILRKASGSGQLTLSYRKLLLFAASAARRCMCGSSPPMAWAIIEATEAFAEGIPDERPIIELWRQMERVVARNSGFTPVAEPWVGLTWCLICETLSVSTPPLKDEERVTRARRAAKKIVQATQRLYFYGPTGKKQTPATRIEGKVQSAILRDIFGDPFRPAYINSAWLQWNGGTVKRLAEQAYQERIMPAGTLDPDRLAVLADALEEAWADAELVGHLRDPGPHVRGCHVVDAVLGKT